MSHQSQFAELKLMLRNNLFLDLDEHVLMDTRQQGLVCHFLGLRLASVFQPIVHVNGDVFGREALLRAATHEQTIELVTAFYRAVEADRLVQFDRLVRTIHLLNHSKNFATDELLFLNVHPRLLTSVNDNHGSTFEHILHYYSVPTSRVVIEIKESAVSDESRLAEAVNNYRRLGYKIAVDDFGTTQSSIDRIVKSQRRYENLVSNKGYAELDRVLSLQPDIVKLDGAIIRAAENTTGVGNVIYGLVNIFHGIGAKVLIEGIETNEQLQIARDTGADLLQGYQLAAPQYVNDARGDIYFTDSGAAPCIPKANQPAVTPRPAVYRINAKGKLSLIANDIERPNGIQLSPNEKVLSLG